MTCEQCDRSVYARGLCQMHHRRLLRGQDLATPPRYGGEVKYQMAHMRIKAIWGPAKRYPCVGCERNAEEWAYDCSDPNELRDEIGPYSINPEFYMPMCIPCHRAFDAKGRPPCLECGQPSHGKNLCRRHYEIANRDHRNRLRRERRARRKLVPNH